MNKLLPMLEKNVQWIALGLGGVWLLYIVMGYWAASPASITISGKDMGPGQVDGFIDDPNGPAGKLRTQMGYDKDIPVPKDKSTEAFTKQMSNAKEPALAVAVFNPGAGGVVTKVVDDPNKPPLPTGVALAKAMPVNPAPTITDIRRGRTHMGVPAKPAALVPAAAPGAGVNPGMPPGMVLPPDMGLPPGVAMPPDMGPMPQQPLQPGQGVPKDVDWVHLTLSLDQKVVEAEYKRVELDPNLVARALPPLALRVVVQRQEQLPDGKWSAPVVLEPPSTVAAQLFAPLPVDAQQAAAYMDWARQNQEMILRPAFYTIIKGDQWPTGLAPVVPVVRPVPVPVAPKNPPRRPGNPPGGSVDPTMPPMMPPPPRYYVTDEAALREYLQAAPPYDPTMPPVFGPDGMPIMPGNPANPGVNPAGPPLAQFHFTDDSAQENKTYRYRATVILRNPLFQAFQKDMDPTWAQAATMKQEEKSWSEWSQPVTIPGKTQFFVVSQPMVVPGGKQIIKNKVSVALFKWAQGEVVKKAMEVTPGDTIPDTNWMAANIRIRLVSLPPRMETDTVVTFMDDAGASVDRTYLADSRSKELAALEGQIAKPVPAVPGGPGTPGGPGMPGGPPANFDPSLPPGVTDMPPDLRPLPRR